MEMLRQLKYFDPHKHKNIPIDIIGLGAVGSYVAWFLSKTGMENITFWDDDIIVDHNIPNQCFLTSHKDFQKVQAAKDMVNLGSGCIPNIQAKKVVKGGEFKFGKVVFLLVDSMSARKEIWDEFLKFKLGTELVVETRMSVDICRVFSINPCNQNHINKWEGTLYSDDESAESLCGATESIVTMASITASMAVTQMIKWLKGGETENEIIFSTDPVYNLITNHY